MLKSAARKRPRGRAARLETPSRVAGRTRKVSLTVDEGVLQAMEKQAKRSGRTLSAEITQALDRDLRRRKLQDLIEEYEAEHEHITAEELAAVQAEWQD
jgi:macrodomain Ter protein organizer (MatP/YcbG family)